MLLSNSFQSQRVFIVCIYILQASTQTFEKGGTNLRNFAKGGGANLKKNLILRSKLRV